MKISILSKSEGGVNSATKLKVYIEKKYGYDVNIFDLRNDLGNREDYYKQMGEIIIPRNTRTGRITTCTILHELEHLGKFVFPRTLMEDTNLGNKIYQQSIVKSLGIIETIPSFVINYPKDLHKILENGKLRFPFIIKPTTGSEGKGIVIFKNIDEWNTFENEWAEPKGKFFSYIIQNFIENDHDYRIFVVGEKAIGIMKRSRTTGFVNNFSQGGMVSKVELESEIGKKLADISTNLCKRLKVDVAGVDIIEDKNKKLYFMEINTTAQWSGLEIATGVNVEEEFINECLRKYKLFLANK